MKMLFRKIVQHFSLLTLVWLPGGMCFSQTFDKGAITWDVESKDSTVELKYRSTGLNSGGYEGTSAIVKNMSADNIAVDIRVTITDRCGKTLTRTVYVSLKPNSTVGGNTWMGGSEQFDYSTQCKERKEYDTGFKTSIAGVEMEILAIRRTGAPESGSDEFTDNADGVAIRITRTKSAKNSAIIRLTNNNKDRKAYVYVVADGKIVFEPTSIESGGTLTVNLGSVQNIRYIAMAAAAAGKKEPPGLFDQFKNWVKDKVTTKPASVQRAVERKISLACMCVRG